MKHYSVKKEHDDHFEIHDKRDGRTFKVAKKSLGKAHEEKVRHMFDAGIVGDPEEEKTLPNAFPIEGIPDPASPAWAPKKTTPSEMDWNPNMGGTGADVFASNPNMASPTGAPKGPFPGREGKQANPNTQAIGGSGEGGMQTASYPTTLPAPPADTGMQDAAKAVQQGMAAQQAAAAATQKAADDYQAKMAEHQAAYDKRFAQLDQDTKAIEEGVANSTIDPHRMWNNASTGNKVLAGIGVLLSGIGSGMTGQQNMAMTVINKAIENDIDAQKAELGKKQNLLSMNYRKYGDLQAAEAATANQLHSVVQTQIAAQSAKMGSAQAMTNGKLMIAQIQAQKDQTAQKAAGAAAAQDIFNQGGGKNLTPAVAEAVAPGQWVNTPAGIKIAKTKEDAKTLSEATQAANNLMASLKDMATFNEKTGTTLPGQVDNTVAKGMRSDLLLQVKELAKLGVLSSQDVELVEPMIPDVGAVRTDKVTAQIMQMQNMVQKKLQAAYAARLVNQQGLGKAPTAGQDQGSGMTLSNYKRP